MKTLFYTFFVLFAQNICAQSFNPDAGSFGFIVSGDGKGAPGNYVGSAFVLNQKRTVITCAHVVDTIQTFYYKSTRFKAYYKLTLIRFLPQYDLAVFESSQDVCDIPFAHEDDFDFSPNQHIFYIGYNPLGSNEKAHVLQVESANLSGYGKLFEDNKVFDFIEFSGQAVQGYSGGPVINDRGKIVGVMSQAWVTQGIKGGTIGILNRAFSILPLIKTK